MADTTTSLFSSSGSTGSATLHAKAGIDNGTTPISTKISHLNFDAKINCDNIPSNDKESNTYTIRANEDLDSYIDENTARTLPKDNISSNEWTVTYNEAEKVTGPTYDCPLGTFTFSDSGKAINLVTPIKGTAEYDAYKKALETKSSLTLKYR